MNAQVCLDFSNRIITTKQAKPLIEELKTYELISHLDLSGADKDSLGFLILLLDLKSVERLTLNRNKYVEHCFNTAISQIQNLRYLELRECRIENPSLLTLLVNSKVTYLDLQGNHLRKIASPSLGPNTTLTHLNLNDNFLNTESVAPIAELFPNLISLQLASLGLGDLTPMTELLKTSTSLTDLCLDGGVPSDTDCLCDALKVNTSLKSLGLSRSRIRGEQFRTLSQALMVNSTLTSLSLAFSQIGETSLEIAEMIKVNQGLTSLDLSFGSLTPPQVETLLEAQRSNTRLIDLRLDTR